MNASATLLAVAVAVVTVAAAGATAQEPLLQATATEARWLAAFAGALDVALPELPAGTCYALRVGADGAPAVTTPRAAAGSPLLDVEVHAAAWLKLGGAAVARTERTLTNRAVGFASLAGLPVRAAAELVDGAFAIARSTDVARLSVRAGGARDYTIRVELVPSPDSPFARWLATPAPAKVTAPLLPWDDAMLRLGIGLRAECLRDVTAPFVPLAALVSGTAAPDLLTRLDLLDGTFAVTLAPSRLGVSYGVRDANAFVARAMDPARLKQEVAALALVDVVAEYTPDVERHRDVELLRSRVTGTKSLPGLSGDDGAVVSFGGCAAGLWLQVAGAGARESAKGAIDDALAGRLRAPFTAATDGPSSWLTIELDLARLALVLAPTQAAEATAPAAEPQPTQAPRRLQLHLSSSPRSLLALIDLR